MSIKEGVVVPVTLDVPTKSVGLVVVMLKFELSVTCPFASKKGTRVAVPRAKVDSKE